MKFSFNNLKFKLTVLYSLVFSLTLAALSFVSWTFLSVGLFNNLEDSMSADFSMGKDRIVRNAGEDLTDLLNGLGQGMAGSAFVYDIESATLFGDQPDADAVSAALVGFVPLGETYQVRKSPDGRLRMYIASYDQEAAPGRLLIITRDSGYIYDTLDDYKTVLYASFPFALVIAGVSGFFLAGRSMNQVKVITATANGIDPAVMTDRIPVKSVDELGRLSLTLNSTFDRIYGFIDRQRRFTADASHDMRAPIALIKMETSRTLEKDRSGEEYKEVLNTVGRATDRLESMIDGLLVLAGLDTVPNQETSLFDLSSLIEQVLTTWEAPCAAKGITLERRIQPDIEIMGEILDLHRLTDNLVSNAVKATRQGGVTVAMNERGDMITLAVTDTGTGIPQDQLEKIFWRFYRVDRNAAGNGLGLPIVEGIAQMYGGRVEVESEVGTGTTFRVFLPVRPKKIDPRV
jgi:signal transduction histidine kinase